MITLYVLVKIADIWSIAAIISTVELETSRPGVTKRVKETMHKNVERMSSTWISSKYTAI